MALWVPIVLAVQSLLIAALASSVSRRRARAREAQEGDDPRYLVHAINDDRCTGCESCVSACPTNVLSLVGHKSRATRFADCVQCEACARACPTGALVMHPIGSEPPPVLMPDIDASFQTRVPGQYLIGESAGKPLVKNAANLGRFAIEHMVSQGVRPRGGGALDVAIVGSGPAGLSAALTCIHHGLSYVMLEKEQVVAATVARYPRGKPFMAEPAEARNLSFLPVRDASKEQLVATWRQLIELAAVDVRRGEAVETVERGDDGLFRIATNVGRYTAQRVVLAVGTRGKPRTLGVPGENLPKVCSMLEDPAEHAGRRALVVGGGDSALEAALALARAGAAVTLAYRGRAFTRAKRQNRDAIEAARAAGRIDVRMRCNATAITERDVELTADDGSVERVPNDAVFVLIGADLPVRWLRKVGVEMVERPHAHELGATDALVRSVAAGAVECPRDAEGAAALIRGERPARAQRRNSTASALIGAARRARAATSRLVDSTVSRLWHPPGRPRPSARRVQIRGLEQARTARYRRLETARTNPTIPTIPARPIGPRRRFPTASDRIDIPIDFEAEPPTVVRAPTPLPPVDDWTDHDRTVVVPVPRLR